MSLIPGHVLYAAVRNYKALQDLSNQMAISQYNRIKLN